MDVETKSEEADAERIIERSITESLKMNRLILIGNLGREPEMRYTPAGQAVTTFSVASNHSYKTAAGEQKQDTEWCNCSAWGRLAEICSQYLKKGQQVYVEGRLKARTYQAQDGETCFSNEVMVSEVQFLGGKRGGSEAEPGREGDDLGDLPF